MRWMTTHFVGGIYLSFDRLVDGRATATAPARLAVSPGGRVRVKGALAALALAAILAMLLVACEDSKEEPTAPAAAGQPEATPTVEAIMEEATATPDPTPTATPVPEPTPVVLGDCRDGMRLQPGEGCRYTGGGSPQANVVLSVQHDGAICHEGGPAKQEIGSITLDMDSVRLCVPGGFERDDAFQSDIVASDNADGSWTFYESALSASAPRSTATAGPTNTPMPAPPLNVYESGQTIPDFPSGPPNALRGGGSLQMVGGNVVITMSNGGTAEYSHATYTCVSEEGCGIENGRVTTGTIRVADPSNVENPTPIPTAAPTRTATATPIPIAAPTQGPTPANQPPRFTNQASFTLAETERGGTTFSLSAVDDDDTDSVTGYAITGGADRGKFSIGQRTTGARPGTYFLELNAGADRYANADYENPTDADGNNVYEVVVAVTSGTGSRELTTAITITITVEVTNVIETSDRPDEPNVGFTTETSVTVTWTKPYSPYADITGYDVRYRPQNTATWIVWPHSDTTRSATITGLTTNADYDVQVRANSPEGASEWSPSVWATAAIHSPPSEPGNVRWTQIGRSEQVEITWNASADATYYKLYHCWTSIDGSLCSLRQVVSRIAAPATEYVYEIFASPGLTTYVRFAVRACNGTGCSARVIAQ